MKVAIIGAGIAGLTAAAELNRRGIEVAVFEKARGSGGRLATRRCDWGHLDIGAQYFTAHSERFQRQVHQWQKLGTLARWEFTPYKAHDGGLTASADDTLRYVGIPDMNSLTRYLAADLQIHYQTRISGVYRRATEWCLYTETDETLRGFDWVVSTLPAEQSRSLLSDASDILAALPAHIHDPCWALALATRGPAPAAVQGIFGDRTISWVSRLSSRPQRRAGTGYDDLWMLHFAAGWSRREGKQTGVDLADTGLSWLNQRLQTRLQCLHHYRHYWRYAGIAANDEVDLAPSLIDAPQQLAVIGAWLGGGRVEGGYLSAMDMIEGCFI